VRVAIVLSYARAASAANKSPDELDKAHLSISTYQSLSSSLMLVLDRVRSSTRLTMTAQASDGPPSLPGRAPGTTTD
jgi:hypothetical protein